MILIIADYYLPGYKGGGPIRTIANTIEWLGDEFDFYILTGDRDFKDTQPYPDVHYGKWVTVGKAKVRYLSPEERGIFALSNIIQELQPDLIYLNSFFAPMCVKTMWGRFLGRISHDIPVLINPRGEFNPGSINHKKWKKRAYLAIVKLFRLYHKASWQAASQRELNNIATEFPNTKQDFLAGNLMQSVSDPLIIPQKPPIPLRVIFLSRISQTKNLHFALSLLSRITRDVQFDIYGPREDAEYWAVCEQVMASMPINIHVAYHGEVLPHRVVSTFSQYHLFLFPTWGESYGHVIWEALFAGCKVLISDQTPWSDLEVNNVGWSVPLDQPEQFIRIIEDYEPHHPDHVQQFAIQYAQKNNELTANRQMFQSLLQQKG